MKKVTSIVIGAGLRGGHVYSQYALDHPDEFQVVAVAEPDKERRESFAKRHNIPEELCFESYEELLGKEKLADCAMICTMDRMHYEPTIMALKKGYHVLCEKPMSPDKKEIIEMGEMAKKYDRILSVCHVLRYSPFFSKLKELLEAGKIGRRRCNGCSPHAELGNKEPVEDDVQDTCHKCCFERVHGLLSCGVNGRKELAEALE